MFVFPKGLVHYQSNADSQNPATAISAFGSANAGTVSVPTTVFATGIDDNILARALKTDVATIQKLKAGLAVKASHDPGFAILGITGNSGMLTFEAVKDVGGLAPTRDRKAVKVNNLPSTFVTFDGTAKSEIIPASPDIAIWKQAKIRTNTMMKPWLIVFEAIKIILNDPTTTCYAIVPSTRCPFILALQALLGMEFLGIVNLYFFRIKSTRIQNMPKIQVVIKASSHHQPGMRGVLAKFPQNFTLTKATMNELPALNGQSVSYAVLQYPAGSLNPPHAHPRAAELLFLVYGSLDVGFVDTKNVLYTQKLQVGDMFIFPKGLVHYQSNPTNEPAVAISSFGSANAGTVSVPLAVFSTGIDGGILATAFKTDVYTIQKIRSGSGKS
ncbi:hypothetical protein POTOM_038988 [Populus tomentosa]|uniref:Cupin type-1 domain-containing protein n=1 Tax=Populus tomentosa TaxID=118781 RepID=A0A8X8CLN9_POPTO|nr:hypothetical protein POTOM_038988 [Populus tomentosa]